MQQAGAGAWLSVQLHVQGLCHRSWVKGRAWSADRRLGSSRGGSELHGGQHEAESLTMQQYVLLHDCTSWDPLGGCLG